jgi:hypothetical protein
METPPQVEPPTWKISSLSIRAYIFSELVPIGDPASSNALKARARSV